MLQLKINKKTFLKIKINKLQQFKSLIKIAHSKPSTKNFIALFKLYFFNNVHFNFWYFNFKINALALYHTLFFTKKSSSLVNNYIFKNIQNTQIFTLIFLVNRLSSFFFKNKFFKNKFFKNKQYTFNKVSFNLLKITSYYLIEGLHQVALQKIVIRFKKNKVVVLSNLFYILNGVFFCELTILENCHFISNSFLNF